MTSTTEIRLSAPRKNALSTAQMARLRDELRASDGAPVVLTGDDGCFSAGLDLKEVAALDRDGMRAFLELLEDVMTAVYLHPAPTVAIVGGHAIAGGCVLTLCCDFRVAVARDDARIGVNEVAIGLAFPPRVGALVRRRIPSRYHEEAILAGTLFAPEGALRAGLVDELAPSFEAATTRGRERLEALAALPRGAYAAEKRALRGTPEDLCASARQRELLDAASEAWTAPDIKARIAARFAK